MCLGREKAKTVSADCPSPPIRYRSDLRFPHVLGRRQLRDERQGWGQGESDSVANNLSLMEIVADPQELQQKRWGISPRAGQSESTNYKFHQQQMCHHSTQWGEKPLPRDHQDEFHQQDAQWPILGTVLLRPMRIHGSACQPPPPLLPWGHMNSPLNQPLIQEREGWTQYRGEMTFIQKSTFNLAVYWFTKDWAKWKTLL